MLEMFKAIANSPNAFLTAAINATQTNITVGDASVLLDAPGVATIGNGEEAETIKYTGKNGNTLTGLTRGYDGVAKAWPRDSPVARYLSAREFNNIVDNIQALNTTKLAQADVDGRINTNLKGLTWGAFKE